MKRVPLAKLRFKELSNTALVTYANKHRLAILAAPGLTNFPDVPFDAAALATLITNFRLALAAAYKGTKTQTATKDSTRELLVQAMQQNWAYVNQILNASAGDFTGYPAIRAFGSTSGFEITNFSTPAGPLDAPMIREITSPAPGQIKILLNKFSKSGKQRTKKIRGTKVYEIRYRTSATPGFPAGPWLTFISSSYITLIADLASVSYDIVIVAKGANLISAETTQRQIVVI